MQSNTKRLPPELSKEPPKGQAHHGIVSRPVTPMPPSREHTPKPPGGENIARFGMLTIRIFSGTSPMLSGLLFASTDRNAVRRRTRLGVASGHTSSRRHPASARVRAAHASLGQQPRQHAAQAILVAALRRARIR